MGSRVRVDPSTSYDLISLERSAIFRLAGQLQERKRTPTAQRADHFQSAAEQADLPAMLALTGNTLDYIECVAGRWQVRAWDGGSGGGAVAVSHLLQSVDETAAQLALETQVRTLTSGDVSSVDG